ncbi:MAG TPA: DMT family transporter [Patescibacteria group bacterium]|nr:DMT family transporter [Patescibacteria group bacterium]
MPVLGQIAALATAFCWSLTAIFFSYSGRLVGSQVVNRSRLLFAMLFLITTHLVLMGTLFPIDAGPERWGWLALSSILGLVLGDTFLFRAYVLVGPRLSMLMMSMAPILSAVLAWLFLGELLRRNELIGISVTVAAIAWVATERRSAQSVVEDKRYWSGLFMAFLGALGQAAGLVSAKIGMDGNYPTISATVIRILVALVILWSIAGLRREIIPTVQEWRNRQAFWAMIAGTIVGPFLGIWLSLVAVQLTPVGVAATLMALPPVILIPLGYFIYNERISRRSILGTVLAFAGVALIFLPF